MGDMGLEIGRQVDDIDSIERTFLRTDTASNAEGFGNESDLGFWSYFDTKTTTSHDRAGFLAFLSTFLWFTLVIADNGNTGKFVRHPDVSARSEHRKFGNTIYYFP